MSAQIIEQIRQLIAEGDLQAAADLFETASKQSDPDLWNSATQIQGDLASLEKDKADNQLTEEEYKVEKSKIGKRLLGFLYAGQNHPRLHLDHSYTVNRSNHSSSLNAALEANPQQRIHYFYLYGGDLQLHTGFFRRVTLDLEGRSVDYLNPQVAAACRALRVELNFEGQSSLLNYQTALLKSLFGAFTLQPNALGPLLERRLSDIVDKSPQLRQLGGQDYVCVYIHIDRYTWDASLTPEVAHWFMEQFCDCTLTEQQPRFLFFFSVEFEEEDEEQAEEIRERVDDNPKIIALPELSSIPSSDIDRWLSKYRVLAPDPRERKKILQEKFSASSHYMIDVQEELEKLIKTYNDQPKG
jgi:hypothetical protein